MSGKLYVEHWDAPQGHYPAELGRGWVSAKARLPYAILALMDVLREFPGECARVQQAWLALTTAALRKMDEQVPCLVTMPGVNAMVAWHVCFGPLPRPNCLALTLAMTHMHACTLNATVLNTVSTGFLAIRQVGHSAGVPPVQARFQTWMLSWASKTPLASP